MKGQLRLQNRAKRRLRRIEERRLAEERERLRVKSPEELRAQAKRLSFAARYGANATTLGTVTGFMSSERLRVTPSSRDIELSRSQKAFAQRFVTVDLAEIEKRLFKLMAEDSASKAAKIRKQLKAGQLVMLGRQRVTDTRSHKGKVQVQLDGKRWVDYLHS